MVGVVLVVQQRSYTFIFVLFAHCCCIRNVGEINTTILRSYFSFLQRVKSANTVVFKDFYDEGKMKKNKQDGGIYFVIVPIISILCYLYTSKIYQNESTVENFLPGSTYFRRYFCHTRGLLHSWQCDVCLLQYQSSSSKSLQFR